MTKTASRDVTLAVDLGGTLLRVALVDRAGRIVDRRELPTPQSGPGDVVDAIAGLSARMGASPRLVAVAAPGPLDPSTGTIYATPNLNGYEEFRLADGLVDALGLPVYVHNDANLAALGEWRFGAGSSSDPMVFLTVSTGVGGGIIRNGLIDEGRHGLAGELGHVIVAAGGPACGFGHRGCLEAVASGTAIAHMARAAVEKGETTVLAETRPPSALTAKAVAYAAREGDAVASRLIDDAARFIGLAVGGIVNAIDPEVVVIGGGLAHAWDLLGTPVQRAAREVMMSPEARPRLRIVPGELLEDAGLLGAAAWGRDRFERDR